MLCLFKHLHQVCLCGLLEGEDRRRLNPQLLLEIQNNFTYETLEGKLTDEQLCALLVAPDVHQRARSRPVTTRPGSSPYSSFSFAGSFAPRVVACMSFCTRHHFFFCVSLWFYNICSTNIWLCISELLNSCFSEFMNFEYDAWVTRDRECG